MPSKYRAMMKDVESDFIQVMSSCAIEELLGGPHNQSQQGFLSSLSLHKWMAR